ncbi:MAG: hypothetical protein SF051_03610 [Elusimicrobiota bacterium]|nr:hypothetical protein [Elusimicrobiota bacterium]
MDPLSHAVSARPRRASWRLLTALALALWAPSGPLLPDRARAHDAGHYDARLWQDYSPSYADYLQTEYGFRLDAASGRLSAPDGRVMTEADLNAPLRVDAPGGLDAGEKRLALSLGFRPATLDGAAVLLYADSDQPYTAFDAIILRADRASGRVADGAAPFDASKWPPATSGYVAESIGGRIEGTRILGADGTVLTNAAATRLFDRVEAGADPLVDSLAPSWGYTRRERGGKTFYYHAGRNEPFTRILALYARRIWGMGERPLDAPLAPGELAPHTRARLANAGVVALPDGTLGLEGRVLTGRALLELLAPMDPRASDSVSRVAAAYYEQLGLPVFVRDGRAGLRSAEGDPVSVLDARGVSRSFGSSGLDDPYDPGRSDSGTTDALLAAGAVERDGALFVQGERLSVRDVIELLAPLDLEHDGAMAAVAAESWRLNGFVSVSRGGRTFMRAQDGIFGSRLAAAALWRSLGRRGLDEPYDPAANPELTHSLLKAGARRDGDTLRLDGAPLTTRRVIALTAAFDAAAILRGPPARRELFTAVMTAMGYEATATGERRPFCRPGGLDCVTAMDGARITRHLALDRVAGLDDAASFETVRQLFTAESPAALGISEGPGGVARLGGRAMTLRDLMGFIEPADPASLAVTPERLLDLNWTGRRVNGRDALVTADGTVVSRMLAASLRGAESNSLSKLGLLDLRLRELPGSSPLDPATRSRLELIAGGQQGFLSESLRGALARSDTVAQARAALGAESEAAVGFWASAEKTRVAGDDPGRAARLAAARAAALRDGRERLSQRLDESFREFFTAQGSAVAAEQAALLQGRPEGMPLLQLAVPQRGVAASYDPESHAITFHLNPELVLALATARAAELPPAQRTPDEVARLAAALSDPAAMAEALYRSPALRRVFAEKAAFDAVHEYGHAVSALLGPAAVERRGLIAMTSWAEEERVAFHYETRYIHERLTQDPDAAIPEHELSRYQRALSGYELWTLSILNDHTHYFPNGYATLPEAREVQAGWIEKARDAVRRGVPGADRLLRRLDEGSTSVAASEAAYEGFFAGEAGEFFSTLRVEGNLALARRHADSAPRAFQHRVNAALGLDLERMTGRLSPAEDARLAAATPGIDALAAEGEPLVARWLASPPASDSELADAASATDALSILLQRSPDRAHRARGETMKRDASVLWETYHRRAPGGQR